MKIHIVFLTIVILILSGCNHQKERIIPKKQLVEMMVDLYICDAMQMNTYLCSQLGGVDSSEIYSSFISKYKYNKKDLDFTLKYYSTKPKKLTLIYDQVFAELSKRADDLQTKANKFNYPNLKNIWMNKGNIQINTDTTSYPAGFDVPLDSAGTYLISAQIKISPADQSKNPYLTAYYYNPQKDIKEERHYFKKTPIFKSTYNREYLIYEKNDNPKLSHLFITIPEQDNKDSIFHKSLSITNLSVNLVLTKSENEIQK